MSALPKNTLSSLEGIASYGCVFMELQPGKKMPTRPWDYFDELHYRKGRSCIELAVHWLSRGNGVGYLLRNRLAGIDCDSMDTVRRVAQFGIRRDLRFPQTQTPSGGRHFLFELPASLEYQTLKHHVCHPKEGGIVVPWDFKLGTRTMLVAPGTIKYDDDGNEIGRYTASPWFQPPILDPRALASGLDIFRDMTPFLRDTRPLKARTIAAMNYLRLHAPICKGSGARKVLLEVARHLVSWYDLDPHFALHLMTIDKGGYIAWNNRCADEIGRPHPWEHFELLSTLHNAAGDPSSFGKAMYRKQEEREFVRWCLASFLEVLRGVPSHAADNRISTENLFLFFLEMSGLDKGSIAMDEFGAEIHKAISAGSITTIKSHRTESSRGFKGADLEALRWAHDLYLGELPVYQDACNF
jgi:hypothetical protein